MNEVITMYEDSVVVAPKKECAGYSAWRSTFQSSEAAAKSAYDDASSLHDDVLVLEQAHKQDQDKIEALEADVSALKRKALIISKANEQLAEQCKENDALKAQNNQLHSTCEAVKHYLENSDIEGHALWILSPHQAPAIHETAWERLEHSLELTRRHPMLNKAFLISIGMFIGAFIERNDLFAPLRIVLGVE